MPRWTLLALMTCLVAAPVRAAEEPERNLEPWKWANFLILAGGIAYMVKKHAGPFYAARSQKIHQDMTESEAIRKDAEARAATVEQRLAHLDADIAALRQESKEEADAQIKRATEHMAAELAKIEVHAVQEIAFAGKSARLELKRHAAELAVALAERKIRARMTPDTQETLVRAFVSDLDRPAPRALTN